MERVSKEHIQLLSRIASATWHFRCDSCVWGRSIGWGSQNHPYSMQPILQQYTDKEQTLPSRDLHERAYSKGFGCYCGLCIPLRGKYISGRSEWFPCSCWWAPDKRACDSQSKKEEDIENHVRPKQNNPKPGEISHSKQISKQNHKTSDIFGQENQSLTPLDEEKVGSTLEIEITELKARLDSMIERASHQDYKFQCNVCGKTSTNNQTMTRHVETHIEGLSYPCNQCGKVSSSSHGLQVHNTREHRK